MNPYAIGHKINHPPPDVSENVCFVDFDIPYTWFPSEYMVHLPYIDSSDNMIGSKDRKDMLRTVAVVAARFIEHGEELYVNYFEDDRGKYIFMSLFEIAIIVPIGYTKDWLLEPPPVSPYFQKKRILAETPFILKIVKTFKLLNMGEKFDTWEQRKSIESSSVRRNIVSENVKKQLELNTKKEKEKLSE